MIRSTRSLAIACAALATLGPLSNESSACCFLHDLFGGCCARPACDPCATSTYYRPWHSWFGGSYCRPACNPCSTCAPQTCNYAPVTCYRNECVTVPVTTYRPCTTCDPCTGCPTTVLRPSTCYMRQVRRVAYTSYRPVSSCAPCGSACGTSCSTCGTGDYGVSGGCNTCGTSSGIMSSPADSGPPAGSTFQTSPGASAAPAPEDEPELEGAGDDAAGPQSTFETSPSSQRHRQSVREPAIDAAEPETDEPQLNAPKDRETRKARTRHWSYRTTAATPRAPKVKRSSVEPIDDGGWRPAKN